MAFLTGNLKTEARLEPVISWLPALKIALLGAGRLRCHLRCSAWRLTGSARAMNAIPSPQEQNRHKLAAPPCRTKCVAAHKSVAAPRAGLLSRRCDQPRAVTSDPPPFHLMPTIGLARPLSHDVFLVLLSGSEDLGDLRERGGQVSIRVNSQITAKVGPKSIQSPLDGGRS